VALRRRLSVLMATAMLLVMMLAASPVAFADPGNGQGAGQFEGDPGKGDGVGQGQGNGFRKSANEHNMDHKGVGADRNNPHNCLYCE
jgi:hypothetical protein